MNTSPRFVALITVISLVALLGACAKSSKELKEQWGATTATAAQFSARYPAFKTAIDAQTAAATTAWKAALAAKGDAQLDQMKAAINMAVGAYGALQTFESRLARIRQLKRSRYVLRNSTLSVNTTFSYVSGKVRAARHEMDAAQPAAGTTAMRGHVHTANLLLAEALTPLRRLERRGRPTTTVVVRKKRKKK